MTHLVALALTVLVPALAGWATPPQAPAPVAPKTRPAPQPTPKSVATTVLEGTIKGPDGKPVGGALVSAAPTVGRGDEPARTSRTDAAGHFKIALASSDPHDIRVEARGLAAVRLDKVRPGQSIVVTLGRGRTIEGTVRDDGGQPIAEARVTARADRGLDSSVWEPGAGAVLATSDARGRFRLEGVAPGLHTLNATARGYGRSHEAQRASRRGRRPRPSAPADGSPGASSIRAAHR